MKINLLINLMVLVALFSCKSEPSEIEKTKTALKAGIQADTDLSDDIKMKSNLGYGTLVDKRDNEQYKTILMKDGNMWMAENLRFETENSWCYNDNPRLCKTYGRLYSWESAKRICPEGWHLPSDDEWWKMASYYGGSDQGVLFTDTEPRPDKTNGQEAYKALLNRGDSKFNAKLGGYRMKAIFGDKFIYKAMNTGGYYWTTDITFEDEVIGYKFWNGAIGDLEQADFDSKDFFISCRCIKNDKNYKPVIYDELNTTTMETKDDFTGNKKEQTKDIEPIKDKTSDNNFTPSTPESRTTIPYNKYEDLFNYYRVIDKDYCSWCKQNNIYPLHHIAFVLHHKKELFENKNNIQNLIKYQNLMETCNGNFDNSSCQELRRLKAEAFGRYSTALDNAGVEIKRNAEADTW